MRYIDIIYKVYSISSITLWLPKYSLVLKLVGQIHLGGKIKRRTK